MNQPEADLPDGTSLAESLDLLLKQGGWSNLPVENNSVEPQIPKDEIMRQRLQNHIGGFVLTLFEQGVTGIEDPREAAQFTRRRFDLWKNTVTYALRSRMSDEAAAVDGLTLKDAAEYSRKQFEEYRREAARLVPGTPEQENARTMSDYWARMDGIIGPASDPD